MINIEEQKVGDVLWFVQRAETSVRGADERHLNDGLIFKGTIKFIELTSFEKMWGPDWARKQYRVVFEEQLSNPDGGPIYGLTFHVRDKDYSNQECYVSREEAEASIQRGYDGDLEDAREALAQAQAALTHCETRGPVMEVSWEAATEGFRIETIMEKQAEVDAR